MHQDCKIKRAALLSALGVDAQSNRLLNMDFPRGDGPADTVMLINSLSAHEEISRDFRFTAEVLSDDAGIALKALIARMVTISLVRNDGSLRHFNGYVTQFRLIRADGGFAFYDMVLEPWLAFTRLRKDCVSFHGRSVIELTETTFAHYRERDWKTRLYGRDDPKLSCANQYNETDHNHLHRRWEASGLHYWYEHRADGHTLWIGDNTTLADPIDAAGDAGTGGAMHFRGRAGSAEGDGIHEWQAARHIGSSSLTLTSFDYKNPYAQRSSGYSLNRQGDVPSHELHENSGAYGYRDLRDGEALAQRRMEEHDHLTQYFKAGGNDRRTQPGRGFKLEGHFSAAPKRPAPGKPARASISSRAYLILSVLHTASNNYQAGRQATSHYDNTFVCVRQDIRWRPGRHYHSQPCPAPGVLTAIVAGPPGEEIHTDGLGRVKVQFHWDRIGQYDENSSAWVRVAMPVAGAHLGQIALPRVKQEVVVLFLDGNIDHPIIVSAVYNNDNLPPWDLPDQRALTGWRSGELKSGGRSNHLVMDDTAGKIQTQIRSDHQHSQLSLGHITRVEDKAGRKDGRGEGWELRTDGHGVARAAKGMLLTTEARLGASAHIKDMGETHQRLGAAHNQHEGLAKLAQQHDAKDTQGWQTEVAAAIAAQNQAIKGATGAGSGFPELSAPHLVLASAAGIDTTSRGSTHLASEQHTAISTGKSLSLACGDGLFASIRQNLRLFVHKAGMKMIAAAGDIDLQALSDSINLLAKLNITHTANRITITAKEEVVINGGGSYARFSTGGIEHGTNGGYTNHAARHSLTGPKNMSMSIAMPPLSKLAGRGVFHLGTHAAAGGRGSDAMSYKLCKDGALVEQGHIDKDGNIVFKHDLEARGKYTLELPNGQHYVIDSGEQLEPHKVSAGIGYHGYGNAGGSIGDDEPPLEKDRLQSNPAMRDHQ